MYQHGALGEVLAVARWSGEHLVEGLGNTMERTGKVNRKEYASWLKKHYGIDVGY